VVSGLSASTAEGGGLPPVDPSACTPPGRPPVGGLVLDRMTRGGALSRGWLLPGGGVAKEGGGVSGRESSHTQQGSLHKRHGSSLTQSRQPKSECQYVSCLQMERSPHSGMLRSYLPNTRSPPRAATTPGAPCSGAIPRAPPPGRPAAPLRPRCPGPRRRPRTHAARRAARARRCPWAATHPSGASLIPDHDDHGMSLCTP